MATQRSRNEKLALNDLLAKCKIKSNEMKRDIKFFVHPKGRMAFIVGNVMIKRASEGVWLFKYQDPQPQENQWIMSDSFFENTVSGREINRVFEDLLLHQKVGINEYYHQYLMGDVNEQNKKKYAADPSKGKTVCGQLFIVATFWFSKGTENFQKMIRSDGTSWLKITVNERDHRFVTSWPGYNAVKYAKLEEKDGAEARLVIQAIGDQDSMSGGAMFAEESDEAIDEIGSEDGSEVYEVEVAECAKPEDEQDARQEARQNAHDEDSAPEGSPQSSPKRAVDALEVTAPELGSPKAMKGSRSRDKYNAPLMPEDIVARLFPGVAETPRVLPIYRQTPMGRAIYNLSRKKQLYTLTPKAEGEIANVTPTNSPDTTLTPGEPMEAAGNKSGQWTRTNIPATQDSDDDTAGDLTPNWNAGKNCGLCGRRYEHGPLSQERQNQLMAGRVRGIEGCVQCEVCEEYFYRNIRSQCNELFHSDDGWTMEMHCNECHDVDGRLDPKYKRHDNDRNVCKPCRDIAAENMDDLQDYDCSDGTTEMVGQFSRKLRALLLRSKGNETTIAAMAQAMDDFNDRAHELQEMGAQILEGMAQVKLLLTPRDAPATQLMGTVLPTNLSTDLPYQGPRMDQEMDQDFPESVKQDADGVVNNGHGIAENGDDTAGSHGENYDGASAETTEEIEMKPAL